MKVEYDPERDLLYVAFAPAGAKTATTEIVRPGVHIDFDVDGRMIGIEVLDAREVLGDAPSVEVQLAPTG